MGVVRIAEVDASQWLVVRDVAPASELEQLSEAERDAEVRPHHPGNDHELQMFEMKVQPSGEFTTHAHDEDEIIYVVDGELALGRRLVAAGSSVYIPGGTLYTLRAGPNGLHFLNFRARQDHTYIRKEAFMARREMQREQSE